MIFTYTFCIQAQSRITTDISKMKNSLTLSKIINRWIRVFSLVMQNDYVDENTNKGHGVLRAKPMNKCKVNLNHKSQNVGKGFQGI